MGLGNQTARHQAAPAADSAPGAALARPEIARRGSRYYVLPMASRRNFVFTAITTLMAPRTLLSAMPGDQGGAPPVITVYKDPSCGCCKRWVKHLTKNGFVVTAHDVQDMAEIKRTMNVPNALEACHTAIVDRYVVEGHVPAAVIKKLLAEKPAILGIAVPGMPAGSPGMEVASGATEHYDVLAFDRDGKTRVYARR
jgi:hypothetical protein